MKIIRSKGLFAMIGEEEKPHVFIDKSEEFRKCLEEIREIAEVRFVDGLNEEAEIYNQDMDRIRNKINEVLNKGAEE